MPVRGNTFKIFIGNLSERSTSEDLREIFQAHGTVVEADAVKNFGFVHMQEEEEGKAAIEALNGFSLHGKNLSVEASTGGKKGPNKKTKIFIGNLTKDTQADELRTLFEEHGTVVECDVMNNYAFVHMETENETQEAIRNLDGYELNGMRMRVQESTSRVRSRPGMGNPDSCYRCGSFGHWSKECPVEGGGRYGGGPRHPAERPARAGLYGSRYDPYGPAVAYPRERMMRYRDVDDYDPYPHPPPPRSYDPYYDDPYDRYAPLPLRALPPMRDPYDRRPLPPVSREDDYLLYGRRTPPSRYLPPPQIGYRVAPMGERRPY